MKKELSNIPLFFTVILCFGFFPACGQSKAKQEPAESQLVGNDRDEHDCIASAGYTWSEVQQNCIRLFESGIRLESPDQKSSVYLVFSPDSLKAELSFSDDTPSEILDRRSLPAGGYAWNLEDDDTKNVRFAGGIWTISQRNKEIYRQSKEEANASLGKMITRTYEGVLPAADCPGIRYVLTVRNREHSGDGTFALSMTYLDVKDGQDDTFNSTGKRFTLRGTPEDSNATVWQLVSDTGEEKTNFLVDNDSTLTLLGADFNKSDSGLNYTIKLVKEE